MNYCIILNQTLSLLISPYTHTNPSNAVLTFSYTFSIVSSPLMVLHCPLSQYNLTIGIVSLLNVSSLLLSVSKLSSLRPEFLLLSIMRCMSVSLSASKKRMKGTSTVLSITLLQPSKLSWLRGKPSIRNFFEAQPFFSIPFFKSQHVISTGTILPSTIHQLIS